MRPLLALLLLSSLAACGDDGSPAAPASDAVVADPGPGSDEGTATIPADAVLVAVGLSAPVAEVDPRFLSVAVDISQVVGGRFWTPGQGSSGGLGTEHVPPFDFSRPRLRTLAAELSPAMLRIGGSEADVTYYALTDPVPEQPPEGYTAILTKAQLDGVADFAVALGWDLFFTLNVGPGPRDAQGQWTPDAARELIAYTTGRGYPVAIWELGNEVHGIGALHGFDSTVSPLQYAADVAAASALIAEVDPGTPLAGPSSAYWPLAGELSSFMPDFMPAGGEHLDVVTWHYYPQQSERCPMALRPAELEVMLSASALDEVQTWAAEVEALTAAHAPAGTPVWLGESGNAQCGGQVGVSDRFAGTFWWLDQLGLIARRGQPILVRQTLEGSEYGLLVDETLEPRPDYWASVLWKRLMGTRVLDAAVADTDQLRAYAHCRRDAPGEVVLLLIHLGADGPMTVGLPELPAGPRAVWVLTADGLDAPALAINGTVPRLTADGALPPLDGAVAHGAPALTLPPRAMAFVAIDAGAEACR